MGTKSKRIRYTFNAGYTYYAFWEGGRATQHLWSHFSLKSFPITPYKKCLLLLYYETKLQKFF